jgi:pimeloyl-ACP methyl ester carboxylesterase
MERRNFMKGVVATGTILPLSGVGAIVPADQKNPKADPATQLIFFKNEPNEFNFLIALGKAHYKFSDVGELLAIRSLIDESSPVSFVNAYLKFADNCKKTADDCLQKGQLISARDAYARASTYYYAAMDYLDSALQSDRFPELFRVHRACWKAAISLMDVRYEEFNIPYEGKTLAGFFMGHKGDESARPLCIFNNGSDGSIVDCWTFGGSGFFERGYNVLTFDGPGQGTSLFEKNIYFRYDWEKVITPVIDGIIHRKDVDRNKMVLIGISQGGYWVPRAAAFEKRLRAIIADPGVTDVSSSWLDRLPPPLISLLQSGKKEQFDQFLAQGAKQSPVLSSIFAFRARPYGISSPFDLYTEVQKYKLAGIAEKIECPVLIASPENEDFWPGQSQALFDMVKSRKQIVTFTAAEGANYHCEPKARLLWEQKMLDALDTVIKG